jgi:flagellar protein FliS
MNPYFEQTILNADPTELIKMVYQRAISCVRDAREHLRHKRIAERSAAITRAYKALEELLAALRPEMAPDLAENLRGLYFYMQQRLLDANIQQADQPLEEVLGLLVTLAEAWSGVVAKLAPSEAAPAEIRQQGSGTRWEQPAREDLTRIAVNA